MPSHAKYFHHFIAQVVDHLDRDASGGGFGEWPRRVAVQSGPSVGVDLGFERGLEGSVRVLHAEEVGVAHEKTLLVVVRVDEPTGDAVGIVAAYLAAARMEDVHASNLDLNPVVFGPVVADRNDVYVGLPKDHEQVALARVLEVVGHVKVGVDPWLQHANAAQLVEIGRVGAEVEGAGDQQVEPGLGGLSGGAHQVGPRDRTELRTDENCGSLLRPSPVLDESAFRAHQVARPRRQRRKRDLVFFVDLLNAGRAQVVEHDRHEIPLATVAVPELGHLVHKVVVLVHAQFPMRGQALHRERAGHSNLALVLVGLVVQVLVVGLRCDRCVDLLLPSDSALPPLGMESLVILLRPRVRGPLGQRFRRVASPQDHVQFVEKLADDGGVGLLLMSLLLDPSEERRCLIPPRLFRVAWDLPFLPFLVACPVDSRSKSIQRGPMLLPYLVDLSVVRDRLERNVRHALVHEALADVAVGRLGVVGRCPGQLCFLRQPFARIREQIVRIASPHHAGPSQGKGNP